MTEEACYTDEQIAKAFQRTFLHRGTLDFGSPRDPAAVAAVEAAVDMLLQHLRDDSAKETKAR